MGKKSSNKKQRAAKSQAKQTQSTPRTQSAGLELASLTGAGVASQASTAQKPLPFGEQTQYIREDIVRICLLLLVVAVLLIAAVILNDKAHVLFNLGKRVASFMQLQ